MLGGRCIVRSVRLRLSVLIVFHGRLSMNMQFRHGGVLLFQLRLQLFDGWRGGVSRLCGVGYRFLDGCVVERCAQLLGNV